MKYIMAIGTLAGLMFFAYAWAGKNGMLLALIGVMVGMIIYRGTE